MRVLIDSLKRLYTAGRLTKEQIAARVEKGTIDEAGTRKSQARSTRQKPRQNNFQCTHAHGSRYCHKHMKECDLDCKESGTCAHCTNYHIPMTQYPCKRCEKLNQN